MVAATPRQKHPRLGAALIPGRCLSLWAWRGRGSVGLERKAKGSGGVYGSRSPDTSAGGIHIRARRGVRLQGMTAHYLIHEFRQPAPGGFVLDTRDGRALGAVGQAPWGDRDWNSGRGADLIIDGGRTT